MLAEEYAAWLARQYTSVARDSLLFFFQELLEQFGALERHDLETVLRPAVERAADMAGMYTDLE